MKFLAVSLLLSMSIARCGAQKIKVCADLASNPAAGKNGGPDGTVDVEDLLAVLAHFGKPHKTFGTVDVEDLLAVLAQFGKTCSTPPALGNQTDCAGVAGGNATKDKCGKCDADPTNDCQKDCMGTWGGKAAKLVCGCNDATSCLTPCPPGQYLTGFSPVSKGKCATCPAGTFKATRGGFMTRCKKWDVCTGKEKLQSRGSSTKDVVCVTPTTCNANEYQVRPATQTSGALCSGAGTCPSGKLIAMSSRTQRDHCGSCDAGYALVTPNAGTKKLKHLRATGVNGCTPQTRCSVCEGDCDKDTDCQRGLKCFQRNGKSAIPGCTTKSSSDVNNWDYCYNMAQALDTHSAQWLKTHPAVPLHARGLSGCTVSKRCARCEGDCDNDNQCMSGLHCFHRNDKTKIIGCTSGGVHDINTWDFCAPIINNCVGGKCPPKCTSLRCPTNTFRSGASKTSTGKCVKCPVGTWRDDAARRVLGKFDSTTEGWTVKSAGKTKWSRIAPRTSTASRAKTGPGQSATRSGYVYQLETSAGKKGEVSYLMSKTFATTGTRHMHFKYHMYGSTMGALSVQAKVGKSWKVLWKKAGQQQKLPYIARTATARRYGRSSRCGTTRVRRCTRTCRTSAARFCPMFRPCCRAGACVPCNCRYTTTYKSCWYNYKTTAYYSTFKASKDITLPSGTTQVRFKGVRGAGVTGKMAVDEVYIDSPSASFAAKCQSPTVCKKTEFVETKADPRRMKDTVCRPRGTCKNGKLIAASAAKRTNQCDSCNKGYKLTTGKKSPLRSKGWSGCTTKRKCKACEGDCDSDKDCNTGLQCFQRNGYTIVPACSGKGANGYDYCVKMPTCQ